MQLRSETDVDKNLLIFGWALQHITSEIFSFMSKLE